MFRARVRDVFDRSLSSINVTLPYLSLQFVLSSVLDFFLIIAIAVAVAVAIAIARHIHSHSHNHSHSYWS
jgi:hypothetical protein